MKKLALAAAFVTFALFAPAAFAGSDDPCTKAWNESPASGSCRIVNITTYDDGHCHIAVQCKHEGLYGPTTNRAQSQANVRTYVNCDGSLRLQSC